MNAPVQVQIPDVILPPCPPPPPVLPLEDPERDEPNEPDYKPPQIPPPVLNRRWIRGRLKPLLVVFPVMEARSSSNANPAFGPQGA